MCLRLRNWFKSRATWLINIGAAIMLAGSVVFAQGGGSDGPVAIQRIFIKPERAAKELDKVQQGALILMPRQEFEDRLDKYQKAIQTREARTQLTQAHYSAEFVDRALANGWGKWTVAHVGAVPAVLAMEPFNLALARPRWEQGGNAILADFDGKTLGLLVKQAGIESCLFDWSARGAVTQEGIAFQLAVPPCPICTFELTLPADEWLTVPKSTAVVTGPIGAQSPNKRLWKVQVTGTKPLEFLIRKVALPASLDSTLLVRTHSIQQLSPDRLAVDHDFQLDIPQGSVSKLVLDADAGIQPFAVSLSGGELKSWQWQEHPARNGPMGTAPDGGVLTVELHEPLQGKAVSLKVRSLAAHPSAGAWTSPAMRLRHAVSRGETLELRWHPEFAIGLLDSGSFQLTSIASDSDGSQKLLFAETASDAATTERPKLIPPLKSVDLRTNEKYVWEINQQGAALQAEIHFAPLRGQFFELRLKLPKTFPGYKIESLDMQPADALAGWRPEGDLVIVDLKQPLTPAKKGTLKLRLLAGLRDITSGSRVLSYPAIEPIDATKREGSLAVVIDAIFRAQLVNASLPLAPADDAGFAQAAFGFRFRDQKPSAAIRLLPRPVQVQLQGKHSVTLQEQQVAMKFRWEAQPQIGTPEFLDFRMAPGFPAEWNVIAAEDSLRIDRWERLPLQEALPHLLHMGSGGGIQRTALPGLLPTGSFWRFHFAEPLQKKGSFALEASIASAKADPGDRVWLAPFMSPVQMTGVSQQITVDSMREPIVKVGFGGAGGASLSDLPKPVNQFDVRLADGKPAPATTLAFLTRSKGRAVSPLEHCDEARQTAFVFKDSRVFHRVQFRLWHWRDPVCELRLPPDVQVIAVRVQDRWLQRLDVAETRLHLPVEQMAPAVTYDIWLRATNQNGVVGGVLTPVSIPSIGWPSDPYDVQSRLCLEIGLAPLAGETLLPVGVPKNLARQTETSRLLGKVWRWGSDWLAPSERSELREKLEAQRKTVLLAESQLRLDLSKKRTLAEVLQAFALTHLKEDTPLVVDAIALQSLGLTGDSKAPADRGPFWEAMGLTYVACPGGALLTTSRRLQNLCITEPLDAVELEAALQEAIVHGRDSSSGFCLASFWLRLPPAESTLFLGGLAAGSPLGEFPEMNEWEVGAAGTRLAQIYVLNQSNARGLGWLAAVLAALGMLCLWRALDVLVAFRLCLALLTGFALAAIWSPVSVREYFIIPVLMVHAGSFLWCAVSLVIRQSHRQEGGKSTLTHIALPVGAVAVVFLSLNSHAPAQPALPRTHIVLIVEGDKPAALVTPELVAKLDERDKQSAPGAVLLSAKYDGKAKDSVVTFDVEYELHSFREDTNILIPLTGVQLGAGAFLDGVPVFPAPLKNGYGVPIRGKGAHHLRLTFTDKAALEGDQFVLAFKVPKLPQNDFVLNWQTPARNVSCQHSCGEERSVLKPDESLKEWRGHLGYENAVNLRWTGGAGVRPNQELEVTEMHFWDLRPAALALNSSLNYTSPKGSLYQVSLAVPERLHVRGVEALNAPAPSVLAKPLLIKRWTVLNGGGQRRLVVEFAQPVTGGFTLNLDMAPLAFTQPTERRLLLPTPLNVKAGAGMLGYRLDAAELLGKANNLRVLGINSDDFEQHWKKQSSMLLPGVSRAYSFQRESSKAAWLELKTQPAVWHAQGLLQWRLDTHFADLDAQLTITSAKEDVQMVEFFVDKALTLAEVTGTDVRRWNLHDTKLQVWLRQPRKETTLNLSGWRAFPSKGAVGEKSFVAPCLYPRQTALAGLNMEFVPAPRTQLRLKHALNLRSHTTKKLAFAIDKGPYEAAVAWSAEPKPTEVSVLTKVQGTGDKIDILQEVRLTPERGQLPLIKLHVKEGPAQAMLLDAPGANVLPVSKKGLKHPIWAIQYPPGLPRAVAIVLRSQVSGVEGAGVPLPVVEIEEAAVRRRLLAWKDVDIAHAGTGKKLEPEKYVAGLDDRADWLKDASAWKLAGAGRALTAMLPQTPPRSKVAVLSSSQNARHGCAGAWVHDASLWVHAPEAAELHVKFPAVVAGYSVLVDRQLHAAVDISTSQFTLPLEASALPRQVELQWRYQAGGEELESPNIAAIQVEQLVLPKHERIVWVPPSMSFPRGSQPTATLLARLVHEAHGHMQITASLAKESVRSAEVAALIGVRQRSFYACRRDAEYAFALANQSVANFDRAHWRRQLKELDDMNAELAKSADYEESRRTAQKARQFVPRLDELSTGVPLLLAPGMPAVSLAPDQTNLDAARRTLSELCLLAAIFLMVFSFFRHAWPLALRFLPEWTAAVFLLLIVFYGWSLIGLGFLAAMLLWRSATLAVYLKNRWALAARNAPSSSVPPPSASFGSS